MKRTNTAQWVESRNRWQINVQKDGIRKTFTSAKPGKTGQREANAKADRWLDDGIEDGKIKVKDLAKKYMADVRLKTSTGNTRIYQYAFDSYILPAIGNVRVSNVTELQLQNIIDKAYSKGLAHKTLSNIRACINSFMKYCRFCNATTLFPENLKVPKNAYHKEKRILQPDDLKILFSEDETLWNGKVKTDPFINAYRFQVLTGLRPGELIGLKWNDISDGIVHINRSINVRGEVTAGKNENAKREFALNELTGAVIEAQKKVNPYEGHIFSEDGEPIKYQHYYKMWQRYRDHNGISSKTSPYEMRHTFVSAVKTLPEGYLKQIVGHSKDMDTYGVYSHQMTSDMENVASLVQSIFSNILSDEK